MHICRQLDIVLPFVNNERRGGGGLSDLFPDVPDREFLPAAHLLIIIWDRIGWRPLGNFVDNNIIDRTFHRQRIYSIDLENYIFFIFIFFHVYEKSSLSMKCLITSAMSSLNRVSETTEKLQFFQILFRKFLTNHTSIFIRQQHF